MLHIFGIVFAEYWVRINREYHVNLVQQAKKLKRKSRVCDLYYLHNNAPIHISGQSTLATQSCTLTVLPHPPYSPDLSPDDFYLFIHLKRALRGRHFSSKDDLQKAVTNFTDEKLSKFFENAFSQLAMLWQKCVDVF